jgi:hypothetical protein
LTMRRNLSRFQDGKITQQGLTTRRLSLSQQGFLRELDRFKLSDCFEKAAPRDIEQRLVYSGPI